MPECNRIDFYHGGLALFENQPEINTHTYTSVLFLLSRKSDIFSNKIGIEVKCYELSSASSSPTSRKTMKSQQTYEDQEEKASQVKDHKIVRMQMLFFC